MTDKTLGQICFEAFMKLKPGDTYEWSDQVKDSWQAAAEAAVREYVKSRREEVFVPEDGPEALQEVEGE